MQIERTMPALRNSNYSFPAIASFILAIFGITMTIQVSNINEANAKSLVTKFSLENGMEVVVIPDRRAPVVTHMVWYRVGAADEPMGQSGIAHFLEHLMFKGTEKIAPGEFSKIISRNGGQDNAFTGQDATAYFQRISKDRLPLMMEMEADRMKNLRLLEKDVVTERKVILEERRTRVDNDPSSILSEQVQAALYQAHPYGIPIIGWEHEMVKLSQKNAIDFYKKYYAPNNAILVVSGDVEPEEVRKLAEKTYGQVPGGKPFPRRQRIAEPPHQAERRVILKDKRAGQATIQTIFIAPSYTTAKPGEAEALDLLLKIAASGTTSRLYKDLVVDKKLASSTGGWYSGSGLDSGRISVYAVRSKNADLDEIEKSLHKVLDNIKENGVTQKELDRARKVYIASYIYGSDSQSSMARRYGWGLVVGRTIEDIEQWPERLKKVTVEDIKSVAQKYIKIKNSVTGILLPEKKEEQKADKSQNTKTENKPKT